METKMTLLIRLKVLLSGLMIKKVSVLLKVKMVMMFLFITAVFRVMEEKL